MVPGNVNVKVAWSMSPPIRTDWARRVVVPSVSVASSLVPNRLLSIVRPAMIVAVPVAQDMEKFVSAIPGTEVAVGVGLGVGDGVGLGVGV